MNTTSDEEWKTYPYLLINVSFTIPEIEPEERQITSRKSQIASRKYAHGNFSCGKYCPLIKKQLDQGRIAPERIRQYFNALTV